MGIRFTCPNGHKLNVKEHLAGKRGVCPNCGAKFVIPAAQKANGGTATAPPAEAGAPSGGRPFSRDAQRSANTDPPSVLITVVEPPSPPVLPPATSSPPPAAPPAFDLAPIPSVLPASPVSNYAIRRERNRRLQMQAAVVLLLAVIVLAVVLIWVLRRGPTEATAKLHNPTHLAPTPPQAYVAEAVHLF